MYLILTHFHQIIGPKIFLSYPENIPDDISTKLLRFFDLDIDENFFEIVLINQKLRMINLYFEISSKWGRGSVEMIMISLAMRTKYESKLVYDFLREVKQEFVNSKNMFKAFYKYDDFHDNDIEIDLRYEIAKKILHTNVDKLIKKFKSKSLDKK